MKLLILILALLIIFFSVKSLFTGLERLLTDSYSCNDRSFPSGNVSGNYLGLNEPQKQELLLKFIEYSKE
jgi:hypothetical protein